MSLSRLTRTKFLEIINTIDIIANPELEAKNQNRVAPANGTTVKESESDQIKRIKAEAFANLRKELFQLTPEELNNTRFTVETRWGSQNIAEYTIEKLLVLVFTRSPIFDDLCNVLEIILKCKILEPAQRDQMIYRTLESHGFPAVLNDLIMEYEGGESDANEKKYDDLRQQETRRLEGELLIPIAVGEAIRAVIPFDRLATYPDIANWTRSIEDIVFQYKNTELDVYENEMKQINEVYGEKLTRWDREDISRETEKKVSAVRSKELTDNLRKQENNPLLHQVLLMRFKDEPAAIDNVKKVLKLFYKYGADFNIRNGRKQTALHICAGRGNIHLVPMLHQYGCGINIIDTNHQTALDVAYATENTRSELGARSIQYLEGIGAKCAKDLEAVQIGKNKSRLFTNNSIRISPRELFASIEAQNVPRFAEYCDSHLKLSEVVDVRGKTCVDVMLEQGVVHIFFENDTVRAAIQSQFPTQDIHRCLQQIDKVNLANAKKEKEEAGLADEDASVTQQQETTDKTDDGIANKKPDSNGENAASQEAKETVMGSEKIPTITIKSMFAKETVSRLKLICASLKKEDSASAKSTNEKMLKEFKKLLEPKTSAELKALIEFVDKDKSNFTDHIFNNFIDLCIKFKKEKNEAISFSEEELNKMKRIIATPACKKGIGNKSAA